MRYNIYSTIFYLAMRITRQSVHIYKITYDKFSLNVYKSALFSGLYETVLR
jgi:hypothetical protein